MRKLFNTVIAVLTILLLCSTSAFAQDLIIKKDKEEIKCKVTEVGIDEIKYKMENNPEGPVFVLRKYDVWKIIYANGTETVITIDKYDANQEQKILDKKRVVKFEIFAPMTGKLTFGYEHVLKVGTNLEGKIGIIGPTVGSWEESASGAFVKAGVKFLAGQDFYINGMRYAHPLKGRYVKLELSYAAFTATTSDYYYYGTDNTQYHTTNNAFAANICFGKQWILGNALTLDIYGGIGYGISSVTSNDAPAGVNPDQDRMNFYSHLGGTDEMPLTYTGGFSLGYIF